MSNQFAFKINLIKASNFLNEEFYTGTIKLKHFLKPDFYKVPVYNPNLSFSDPNSGYQREAKEKRIQQVSDRLKNMNMEDSNAPFVDNVNLNLRNSDIKNYVTPLNKDRTGHGDVFEFKFIDALGPFYIIDGQTRIKGAQRAYQHACDHGDFNLRDKLEKTQVQISLSFISDIYKEAYLFYLINNHSKAIPADGAIRLLQEGKKSGSVIFQNEIDVQEKGKELLAYGIAEKMNTDSEIWAGKMKDFNESSSAGPKTSIRATSKVLEKVCEEVKSFYQREDIDDKKLANNVYAISEAFWVGLSKVFPQMFKPETAGEYAILKAGPSEIMFLLLIRIIRNKANGISNPDVGDLDKPDTYKALLYKLNNLSDISPAGKKITGKNIFRVGSEGAIGKYSNSAAKKNMADLMKQCIWAWQ